MMHCSHVPGSGQMTNWEEGPVNTQCIVLGDREGGQVTETV